MAYRSSDRQQMTLLPQSVEEYAADDDSCFGHIKRNLKTDAFLLHGRDGVQSDTSLLATCFNIARMITICEVGVLREKLSALNMMPVLV